MKNALLVTVGVILGAAVTIGIRPAIAQKAAPSAGQIDCAGMREDLKKPQNSVAVFSLARWITYRGSRRVPEPEATKTVERLAVGTARREALILMLEQFCGRPVNAPPARADY